MPATIKTNSGLGNRSQSKERREAIKLGIKMDGRPRNGAARVIKPGSEKKSASRDSGERQIIRLGKKNDEEAGTQAGSLLPGEDRIRFYCNRCRNRIKAKYGQEGNRYHCPFCSEPGTVPYPDKPHKNQEDVSVERKSNRQTVLVYTFCLLLLVFLCTQPHLWMPIVGLKPPQASQEASVEQSVEATVSTHLEDS